MAILAERIAVSLKHILLATDFTETSEAATAYAQALALRFSSSVDIVNVFDPSAVASFEEALIGVSANERRRLRSQRMERLRGDFIESGIDTETALPEGHRPFAAVLRVAKEHDTDLIVAGTKSKWGLERWILGSTAEELIRNARCPVLTVGPRSQMSLKGGFRSILFATDFSPEAARAAEFALSLAQDSSAHVYFCYVASPQITAEENSSFAAVFKKALEKLVPDRYRESCSPECVVEHGEAGVAILDLADRVHADLIVLGARKGSFWLTHVERGLTPDLLAEATCPVMTIC